VSATYNPAWDLTSTDRPLVEAKRWANRLRFAVMLLFFRARGRFPRAAAEVDGAAVAELARTLGVPEPSVAEPLLPDAGDRTAERQRAEIRALLGFREAGVTDAEALGTWLRDNAIARTRDPVELAADAEARCRALCIEPPTPDRIARIVRTAVRAYEDGRTATAHARLTPAMRVSLDALLQPAGPERTSDAEDGAMPDERVDAPLIHLRAGPGRASVASLRDELARLGTIRQLGLPADLFIDWSQQELEAGRQRVAVEAPHELRRHPEATRHVWLAAYAHLRGRAVTDTLVDLLPAPKAAWEIETVHHIGARAEHRVEQELLDDLKRVGGKQGLLFNLAGAAVEKPDGTIREVLFPVVGEQTFHDLVRESKATGPTYRTTLRATIRSSYRGHYRRAVLDLLAALDFRSNNDAHRPVIRALDLVRCYADSRLRAYPIAEDVPLDGIVRPLWRDAVVDQDPQGRPRVDRITYEICALEALRDQLRCKEVWVAGANRYRNPDEDLPADFDAQRAAHYQALNLPLDASVFIDSLREEMRAALATLDHGLPRNPDVRITRKRGGWISLTPLQPRPSPLNIEALKAEVTETWPLTSLLDIVKETDLRLGFTDRLRGSTTYEALDRAVLRPRLLLCLNGLGTNAGLKRMDAAQHGATYKDLLYARRRYVTVDQLRGAVATVANGTLRPRSPNLGRGHQRLRVGQQAFRRLGPEPHHAVARPVWRTRGDDLLACRAQVAVHPFAAEVALVVRGGQHDRGRHAPLHRAGGGPAIRGQPRAVGRGIRVHQAARLPVAAAAQGDPLAAALPTRDRPVRRLSQLAARAVAGDRLGADPPAIRRDDQIRDGAAPGHSRGRGHPAPLHS